MLRKCWLFMLLLGATGVKAEVFVTDREAFFSRCSAVPNYEMVPKSDAVTSKGKTRLSASMRAGLSRLLDVWEKHGDDDPRRLAYVLATARRESMSTFSPIREAPKCHADETCRERVIGQLLAERAQRAGTAPRANYALPYENGQRYYGRGFIQLTHYDGYRQASRKLRRDLIRHPDLALEPSVAGEVLVRGMLEGWFGDRQPLSFYIDGQRADWINARNNVNPRSPNKPVTAAYAQDFLKCLAK